MGTILFIRKSLASRIKRNDLMSCCLDPPGTDFSWLPSANRIAKYENGNTARKSIANHPRRYLRDMARGETTSSPSGPIKPVRKFTNMSVAKQTSMNASYQNVTLPICTFMSKQTRAGMTIATYSRSTIRTMSHSRR